MVVLAEVTADEVGQVAVKRTLAVPVEAGPVVGMLASVDQGVVVRIEETEFLVAAVQIVAMQVPVLAGPLDHPEISTVAREIISNDSTRRTIRDRIDKAGCKIAEVIGRME